MAGVKAGVGAGGKLWLAVAVKPKPGMAKSSSAVGAVKLAPSCCIWSLVKVGMKLLLPAPPRPGMKLSSAPPAPKKLALIASNPPPEGAALVLASPRRARCQNLVI